MPAELVISLARQSLLTVLYVAGPMLLAGLVTGVLVSLIQATTQVNEQTMAFVPKIVVIFLAALFFGPWMINVMTGFAAELLGNLPNYVR